MLSSMDYSCDNHTQNNEMTNTVRAFTRTYAFSAKTLLYVALKILKHKLHMLHIPKLYKLKAIMFIREGKNR
jgi:hypothetical protein